LWLLILALAFVLCSSCCSSSLAHKHVVDAHGTVALDS
jgi:hypothetical protein